MTKYRIVNLPSPSPRGALLIAPASESTELCPEGVLHPRFLDSSPSPHPAQGFAENSLLSVTLLFSSMPSLFHLGWKGDSEADNYIADVGFLEEN